jgi:Animal haem peroxidase
MKSSIHGQVTSVPLDAALTATLGGKVEYSKVLSKAEAKATASKPNVFRFGSMFPSLANQRLPDTPGMAKKLLDLAHSMQGGDRLAGRDTPMPAVYTYLGQFIDHDITKTETLPGLSSNMEAAFHVAMVGRDITPLDDEAMKLLVNKRVPTLNLDSVLSSAAPRDAKGALVVGPVTVNGAPPRPTLPFNEPAELKDLHDVPRNEPSSTNEDLDRRAKIGDPRNDENVVIAQLQVAFLRAHRRLVHGLGLTSAQADLELQRSYQSIVINDYLPTVCEPAVVKAVLERPTGAFYNPTRDDPYMPLEFAVAAYRFGHSQVRNAYNYNSEFSGAGGKPIATLNLLFTFTAFSGQNAGLPTLPQNWIIDWSRWLAGADGKAQNVTRRVDTLLAAGLMQLPQHQGVIGGSDVNILAVRNLIRGYLLRLPTGQAVAAEAKKALGAVVSPLTAAQLRDIAKAADADGATGQLAALTAGGFDKAAPLWYYTLAEAAARNDGRLGTVGSFIVAEVLVQLTRLTEDNFLLDTAWRPRIPTAAPAAERKVMLADLLRFAQVLP